MFSFQNRNFRSYFLFILYGSAVLLLLETFGFSSGSELSKLDIYSERYRVDRVIKKIKSEAYNSNQGFSFVVWGDHRANAKILDRLWYEIQREKALFAISTGDLVSTGAVKEWDKYFFPIIDEYRQTPFLSAIGNHDVGHDRQEYIRIFGLTDYAFDYGNARFIVINDNRGLTSEQLKWLEGYLKSATGPYKFVFAHQPPETIEKWAFHSFSKGADEFCSLMQKYQVTMVFHGHIHAYSTVTYRGIQYVVTGGGGAKLRHGFGPLGSVYHYCVVHVAPQGVSYEVARLIDGKMIRSPGE